MPMDKKARKVTPLFLFRENLEFFGEYTHHFIYHAKVQEKAHQAVFFCHGERPVAAEKNLARNRRYTNPNF